MSTTTTTEEDTELRDLVATTLENAGILGKIKAELRANVYIALEEGEGVKSSHRTEKVASWRSLWVPWERGKVGSCSLWEAEERWWLW